MKIDVVVPKNNGAELLAMAIKLGFKEIIFLYNQVKEKPTNPNSDEIKVYTAGLINNMNDLDKARRNYDFVFAPANRAFFENKHIKYLINAEADSRDELLYQKRAGLDDIMCRVAKEKNKVVVFNTSLLAQDKNKDKNRNNMNIFGRMQQNARLCRKYRVETLIVTFASTPFEMRTPKDLDGFARALKLL